MATKEFKFEIKKHIGILSTNKSGWNRELNVLSWNDGKPKWDLRDWTPEHDKMSKGISLNAEELAILKEVIEELDPYSIEE